MRIAMTLLALSLSLTACKKKGDEAPPTAGSGSAMGSDPGSAMAGSGSAMAGSGSAMAGSGSAMGSAMTGSAGSGSDAGSAAAGTGSGSGDAAAMAMAHKAGMCPSTVFGATTTASVKDGKITVTITSDDKDAVIAIQKRTEESLKEKVANNTGGTAHDQKGTHGGGTGLCPVHVPEGVSATSKKESKGVIVTLAPKDPKGADALKTEIDGRIAKSADWVKANIKPGDAKNQGGDGGGKGPHGSNHTGNGDGTGKDKKGSAAK